MAGYDEVTRKIQDVFIQLYGQKQLHEITVKEICQKVGIQRTAFYNYYSDIYDVLEMIENILIHNLKEINKNFYLTNVKDNVSAGKFFQKTLAYITENVVWFRTLLNKSKDGQFIYKWKRIIKEDVSKKYEHEGIELKNEMLVLEMIASSTIGVFMYWVNNPNQISAEDVEEEALHRLYIDFR